MLVSGHYSAIYKWNFAQKVVQNMQKKWRKWETECCSWAIFMKLGVMTGTMMHDGLPVMMRWGWFRVHTPWRASTWMTVYPSWPSCMHSFLLFAWMTNGACWGMMDVTVELPVMTIWEMYFCAIFVYFSSQSSPIDEYLKYKLQNNHNTIKVQ